ncbi:uncharacterized protein Z520_03009 [Fonsecaea multimorphosa CBS 102226]|uniref:Major facilitator superfamily (MFS) profile domain-containing protein n=1 Tax=Fonsecaea multimorphosa CBS 102226 TaxID=1442371 RepID=A0A0D2IWV8_9EURO|nr:uncharacterized protein Z520_03009 [Fonsecaea multimorphosa CBS 102226]KIY01457.1 hypothetical protein Z520_03009 [Fonsecaea multimorphosa CBS 102226]OAL28222.1 hypothetical protein AYO22_02928 [Fonsecaea multimorphosa]
MADPAIIPQSTMTDEKAPQAQSNAMHVELEQIEENSSALDVAMLRANEEEHAMTFGQAIKRYPLATMWAALMSFTIVMEGYDTILIISYTSYPSFVERFGTYYPELDAKVIPADWQSALSVAGFAGSVFGLLMNGYLTERFGYRKVMLFFLVALTGTIFLPFFAPNLPALAAGMVLCGIPWGIFAMQGPAYASEVVPLALRGVMTSAVNLCWVLGQLVAAGVLQGLVNDTTNRGWRLPFGLMWIWIPPLIIVGILAPQSPWWLVRQGRLAEAEQALQRLQGKDTEEQVRLKLAMIVHTNKLEQAMKTDTSIWHCFRGTNLRRTEIACLIVAGQALSGQAFGVTNVYFFVQAGLGASGAYKLSFGGTAVSVTFTVLAWILMHRVGRRTIVLCSLATMCVIYIIIGALDFKVAGNHDLVWAQGGLLVVWLALFQLSLGPLAFTIAAEVSATRLRSVTLSMARNFWNVWFITTMVVEPYLINPTKANLRGKTALVWLGTSVLLLIWAIFRLPETKDRTFEEVDVLFEKRIPAWRFKSTRLDLLQETRAITQEIGRHGSENEAGH